MRISIKEQVNPTSEFSLEVVFRHGDSHSYSTEVYNQGLTVSEADIRFFEACKALSDKGMGGDDGYWKIPGYYVLGESNEMNEEGYHIYDGKYGMPSDSEYCDGHAGIESISLFYYNSLGVKHRVEYDLEK